MYLPTPFHRISKAAVNTGILGSIAILGSCRLYSQDGPPTIPPAATHVIQRTAASSIITLEPDEPPTSQNLMDDSRASRALPANFRQFAPASVNQGSEVQTLTFRFHAGTTINSLEDTKDFRLVQGGSCAKGEAYLPNATCTVMIQFTPQGPGHRLGKLTVTNSADAEPMYVGLGGSGEAPVVSFTPSVITTLRGTYPNSVGLISTANSLAIDGGDTLYIADYGNNTVRRMDSTGTFINENVSITSPLGIAVNGEGIVYVTETATPALYEIYPDGYSYAYASGSDGCAVGAECPLRGYGLNFIGMATTDPYGNVFLNLEADAEEVLFNPDEEENDSFLNLRLANDSGDDAYVTAGGTIGVDGNDMIYTISPLECLILATSINTAQEGHDSYTPVAGAPNHCGFSGDGGQARNAEIGGYQGGIVFDSAGNLYFSDTDNERLRRIDAATGLIQTIAGNGTAGYTGDNGPAPSAELANPTGVAVDSSGQVYVLSSTTVTGTSQVVRVVTTTGRLSFAVTAVGATTAVQTVQVSNTGNAALTFTHTGFSSGNSSDFIIDPTTTTCNFTVSLASGQSCKVGFTFKPTAVGLRAAYFALTDNTLTGVNTIYIAGIGATTATLTPASLTFASTTVGSSATAQTATLTNTGSGVLTISSLAISGAGKSSYSFTDTCGSTLAAAAKCTISITFKPTAAGSLPATLLIGDNATTSSQAVSLSGTGKAPAITTPTKPKQPPAKIIQ